MTTETQIKHIHTMAVSDSGKFGLCKCGRHLEFDTVNPKNPPKVLNEGNPNYVDPVPVTKPAEKLTETLTNTPVDNSLPRKPSSTHLISEYIDENKDAILDDYRKIGLKATLRHWHIGPSAFRNARLRWGEGITRAQQRRKNKIPEAVKPEPISTPELTKWETPETQTVYVETVSPIGVTILNRLIDYWVEKKDTLANSKSDLALINQTIDCLEMLAARNEEKVNMDATKKFIRKISAELTEDMAACLKAARKSGHSEDNCYGMSARGV
jgi:hypothetical protein